MRTSTIVHIWPFGLLVVVWMGNTHVASMLNLPLTISNAPPRLLAIVGGVKTRVTCLFREYRLLSLT
jgi:hypothetical protein